MWSNLAIGIGKIHYRSTSTTYIFIASRAPLIRLPDAHLKFKCNVLHSNVDFFIFIRLFEIRFFFDSPKPHVQKLIHSKRDVMKHTVEILLTLSTTFKGLAYLQCVNAKTEISLSLDMTTYFHKYMTRLGLKDRCK